MKKWSNLALFVCLLSGLQGCYRLGLDAVPDAVFDGQIQACTLEGFTQESDGLRWQLDAMASSPALVTERNLWGRVTRYVLPFTDQTLLFELDVENTSSQILWLDPAQIQLLYADRIETALDVTFFERVWPVLAVEHAADMLDRSLAMAEVYRSLLRPRSLLPGERYRGRLAFRRLPMPAHGLRIQQQRLGQALVSLQFCLQSPSN